MGLIAVVFPGQGSQKRGMAQDFFDNFSTSRAVFEEASEALSLDMAALCFGPGPLLDLTENTQPAILTAEIAMHRALVSELGLEAQLFGGHSLGEYTALVAAGVIPLAEAVRLVQERGRRMQQAVPVGAGAMAALIGPGLDLVAVEAACSGLRVGIANLNSPDQIVLSGAADDLERAEQRLRAAPELRGIRLRRLSVSAPFHSHLMAPIEPGFRQLLTRSSACWDLSGGRSVLCNFTGDFYPSLDMDPAPLIDGLTRQISGTVRWTRDMAALSARGPDQILEVGPRRPLRGFFRAVGVSVDAVTNLVMARRVLGG